jgi:hypothetical protein
LRVLTTPGYQNAAKNRNQATDVLLQDYACDAVSYFDADDRMHPQRLEAVEKALERDADVVMHSFNNVQEGPWVEYKVGDDIELGKLARSPTGCVVHLDGPVHWIHHSQVSVRKVMLGLTRFPEEMGVVGREDALFSGNVVQLAGARTAYIHQHLSQYEAHGSWLSAVS